MEIASRRPTICSQCIRRIAAISSTRSFKIHVSRRNAALTEATPNAPGIEALALAPKSSENFRTRRKRMLQQQLGESGPKWEEMPFQCFQEARKFLLEDRQEKLQQIQSTRERMATIQAQEVEPQNESSRQLRLSSLKKRLEELKIHADINDPLVKKRFEDGKGNLAKPIFRYLADKKWREYEYKIVEQRITQMSVVPDVLPQIDISVQTKLTFDPDGARVVLEHGKKLPAQVTEKAPLIKIQPFDKGLRLYTIAVVNPDVPDVGTDGFTSRCHYLAVNVPISPTETTFDLADRKQRHVVQPWLPAYAQKGLPYQRLAVIILEQPQREDADATSRLPRSEKLDAAAMKLKKYGRRDGFTVRALTSTYRLKAVGADLFRTEWDETTAGVMERAGIIGADVEFKRKRIEPLPYKRMSANRYR